MPLRSRRLIGALLVAAAVHAVIGYWVYEAKFQPHYQEAPATVIEAHLVQPPPPPPPPPPPKQPPKPQAQHTPHPVTPKTPPPTLTPRPPRQLADIAPPQVLPIAPSLTPKAAPSPPVVAAPEPAPPPPPERPHVITNPDWLRMPNADDLARYYPEAAQRNGVTGQATISCAVSDAGSLVDCSVAAESPKDQGFGNAALKMAGDFKMRPETRDGVPVGGAKIRIPIRFNLPAEG